MVMWNTRSAPSLCISILQSPSQCMSRTLCSAGWTLGSYTEAKSERSETRRRFVSSILIRVGNIAEDEEKYLIQKVRGKPGDYTALQESIRRSSNSARPISSQVPLAGSLALKERISVMKTGFVPFDDGGSASSTSPVLACASR
ncbi:hypothetical protein VTG60DRAFT_4040 [Thermothelomyces hinnuleus]